jgi:Icc protein
MNLLENFQKYVKKVINRVFFIFFILFISLTFSEELNYPINKEIEKLAKKPCKGNFSFVVTSDNHKSNAYEFLLEFAKKLNVDFILNCGDFTDDGKDEEYNLVFSQIRKTGIPHFFAPGNHEYRTPEGRTSFSSRRKYKKIFGAYDYYFDFCGWRFISMENVALDMLTDAQLEDLKQTLKGKENKTVVFMHYPPGCIEKWESSYFKANCEKFLKILEEYKVRYAFFGHFHQYDRVVKNNTIYILCPPAGGGIDKERKFLNDNASGSYFGLIYVTVDGDNAVDFLIKPNIEFQK